MQNIGYIIDELLRNHTYKIIVIHWINYQPFEQPGQGLQISSCVQAHHRSNASQKQHNQPRQTEYGPPVDKSGFFNVS